MTNIIINADDLGLSKSVNEEIEDFIKKGLITSTTMMANGEALEDAIRIAKHYNGISFGVHLCLDEFKCLTKSDVLKNHGVVDDNFIFTKKGVNEIKKPTEELKSAIADELNAQIRVFYDAGINISHIDGHHHCHTRKIWILNIVTETASRYGIKKMRRTSSNRFITWRENFNSLVGKSSSNSKQSIIKQSITFIKTMIWVSARVLFNAMWLYKAKRNFILTDKFYSYYTFFNNESRLKYIARNKTVELMCHPGHLEYKIESDLIMNKAIEKKIKCNYISYNDVN